MRKRQQCATAKQPPVRHMSTHTHTGLKTFLIQAWLQLDFIPELLVSFMSEVYIPE